jgi:iron-sulfur cluster assembly protein
VKKSGCSGWAYQIEIATAAKDDDVVFPSDGVAVRVDPASLPQVDGTEIDFVKQGLNQQFVFRNPLVADECGCGESFTTA